MVYLSLFINHPITTIMRFSLTIWSLIFFIQSFSQTVSNEEKIKNYLETYFKYDREIIHVQFNKNIYVNNEDLVFKGYVFNKNKFLPANTTNVQLAIYNEHRQLVQKQLLFTSLGTFEGGIHLNEKFTTGKYYFHFYTNWMNNFNEDDSFTQTIEIINRNEPYQLASKEPNWKSAKIEFFPENGKIINDIINKVGIKITDCNQKGIKIEGKILDSKSKEVAQFKTNEIGNASFYLNPDNNEKYTLQIKTDKLSITEHVPDTQKTGFIINYNNNLSNNTLAVVLKTNTAGIAAYQNKKLILLIHQNANYILKEFTFDADATEKTLRFDKTSMANGVNTIRVIDEEMNEIAERLVYIEPALKPEITFSSRTIANDSLALSIYSNFKKPNLSVSILSENNACITNKSSIIGTMYLNGYLNQPEEETYIYFNNDNKFRKLDMELLLLNQNKNKYLWSNIKSNPAPIKYPFTQGVTIKGKIENEKQNSKYKISLVSIKNKIFEETPIDKNNQFTFKNVAIQNSDLVLLQVMDGEKIIKNNYISTKTVFLDSISVFLPRINLSYCPPVNNTNEIISFAKLNPNKNAINLDEVTVKGTKKMIHKEKNPMATAYKVNEHDFGNILDYLFTIREYDTGYNGDGTVYIRNRKNSIVRNMDVTPTVYLDDIELFDLNLLTSINMEDVDEVYIDKMGISSTNPGGYGTIKIYLKDGSKSLTFKPKISSVIIRNGFAKSIPFNNTPFETAKEFDYFGTLNWTPYIIPFKNSSSYEIKFPRSSQKEIQVLLEGFSEDGQLISEIKKIPISNL